MTTTLIDLIPSARRKVRYYGTGVQIFVEGEQSQGIYFVRKGAVELSCAAGRGEARHIRVAGPGEIFGLTAVVSQRPNECSAITKMPTEIIFVERDELQRSLQETPAAGLAVVRLLSNDVNDAYDQLRTAAV